MIILKFGGTSVSTKKSIVTICEIAKKEMYRQPIIIVSAVSKVTDTLLSSVRMSKAEQKEAMRIIEKIHISLINELFNQRQKRIVEEYIETCLQSIKKLLQKTNLDNEKVDELVSYGERMSSFIIAQRLNVQEIHAEQILATKLIVTDYNFGSAEFLPVETEKKVKQELLPRISKRIVPVITGFIGSTKDGRTTTLGRGGSDYSASIIGACLQAEEIQFWKDVDGIYTADPRINKNAKLLQTISYLEATELAMRGAKVLHPRAILPLIATSIPVRVMNTFQPGHTGTHIVNKKENFI